MEKTCEVCKITFPKPLRVSNVSWKVRKFCSSKCQKVGMWNKRGRNTVLKKCIICETSFLVSPWRKDKARSCSIECEKQYRHSSQWKNIMSCILKDSLKEKGIKTSLHYLRQTIEYKLWRESVFIRDNYTCKMCNVRGGKLNADHIKPFALYPELRFDISNGRTLCVSCHLTTPTFGFGTYHLMRKQKQL